MNVKAMVLASAAALALILGQAACSRSGPLPARQAQAGGDAPDPGYHAAPLVNAVTRSADGSVSLSGRALPSSPVRMVSPPGATIEARADGSGAWTASLGPVSEPALYRLTEQAGGQTVEAEGFIAVLPGVPTVALLRAGFGAAVVQASGQEPLKILAVDYDLAGAAVVSGRARASSPVRVLVDGQPSIEGAAGSDGRFSLTLSKPLRPGSHRFQALTPQATAEAVVTMTPPSPPRNAPFQAQSLPSGWRVDWITPGGGVQTTVLLAG
jgi:hypothetical protein